MTKPAARYWCPCFRLAETPSPGEKWAILKYVLGEETREHVVETIRAMATEHPTYREAEILHRQIEILTSVVGKEENLLP